MPGPQFFVDRSLGRVRVPALLRADGWTLVTLAEHYGIPKTSTSPTSNGSDWLASVAGQC